jgi:hypothetical protein
MPSLNIINNLLPSASYDSVAIFDKDYNQLFQQARSIKVVVKENSKLMEHPIETGAVVTDHRILLPTEIEMSLILASSDYADVYQQIKQYYLNATQLIVQTRAGIYQNQLIESLPHEEDPNMYNALTIALSMKEVLYVNSQYAPAPKYPSNSARQDRGTQQGKPANNQQTSAAYDGLKYASKSFGDFTKFITGRVSP